MIANERQYHVTKAAIARFEHELTEMETIGAGLPPQIQAAQRAGVEDQLRELYEEAEAYERLQSGQIRIIEALSFDDLPDALIKARIASGMSQTELAAKLGMPRQQIQRYEETRYASASFARLKLILSYLGHLTDPLRIEVPTAQGGGEGSMRKLDD